MNSIIEFAAHWFVLLTLVWLASYAHNSVFDASMRGLKFEDRMGRVSWIWIVLYWTVPVLYTIRILLESALSWLTNGIPYTEIMREGWHVINGRRKLKVAWCVCKTLGMVAGLIVYTVFMKQLHLSTVPALIAGLAFTAGLVPVKWGIQETWHLIRRYPALRLD